MTKINEVEQKDREDLAQITLHPMESVDRVQLNKFSEFTENDIQ